MTEPAITPADIEAKFRDIQGQVDVVAQDSKKRVAVGGAALGLVLLMLIYMLGRRTGKRRSTVLEIRRL
ncbi:MAG: hypothetical protein AAF467_22640 [Actinomycetota bacterium]